MAMRSSVVVWRGAGDFGEAGTTARTGGGGGAVRVGSAPRPAKRRAAGVRLTVRKRDSSRSVGCSKNNVFGSSPNARSSSAVMFITATESTP
ncbi:hypothetical protein COSO111634_05275 [Corallococcus soli]